MRLARSIAERSVDPRLQVGCVIVSADDRRVLGVGYNGDEAGGANAPDSTDAGASGFVHAEVNALIKSHGVCGSIVYITHSPCVVCARALVNERVARVVYGEAYRDTRGIEILLKSGVSAEEMT
jgi:dCMP deaminase